MYFEELSKLSIRCYNVLIKTGMDIVFFMQIFLSPLWAQESSPLRYHFVLITNFVRKQVVGDCYNRLEIIELMVNLT